MFSNLSESCPELLLACLVIVLSIWFWRRRYCQLSQDAQRTLSITSEDHQYSNHPDVGSSSLQTAPVQSPAVPSDVCSVVVNASNGSVVNVPTFNANHFNGPAVLRIITAGNEPEGTESAGIHSDESALKNFLESHKNTMRKKTECIFEGKRDFKNKIQLKKIYTQLFITEGELKNVNNEHEILKIMKDKAFRVHKSQEKAISCNEIFSQAWENEDYTKTVLTKGIAGIGKTVSVQKFILDWAEGDANQHIDCIFLLPFRELNLIQDTEYSLHELLLEFHPKLEEVKETKTYEALKLAFIFDGLDESRLPLDFNGRVVRSIHRKASVDSLITSLIMGNLLPSALIWITSRPAAANQVPSEHVSMFTEVRGFTDQQKEEYFKKKITDEAEASKIISHIKFSRSLYIMCHIPVFCWITASVLQEIQIENKGEAITLTEMYTHFLLIQMNIKDQKYAKKMQRDMTILMESNRELILKLAKLAFEQLKKGNIMFYESDLKECGIDISEETEYSGMCAEIFKQESVLHEKKVYCFIHLSLQEFLAALHVFYAYMNKNMEDLKFFFDDQLPGNLTLDVLLKNAVDKAKDSDKGHLDLFLRFLLGISHESNQKFLRGILPHTENTKKSLSKVIQHIRQMQNNARVLSPEKSINHYFCLLELKDNSLYKQINKYLNVESLPDRCLSLSNCSAMAYMLLMSDVVLDELHPKKYNTLNAACQRLIPAVRCCRKAVLAGCELPESSCEYITAALQSENCPLRELDLSDNYSLEKAAKLLSDGFKSLHCKLEILRLARCHFTSNSCAELVSALCSISIYLKALDLSNNDLHDTGLSLLLTGMEKSCCKLQSLRLAWCNLTEKSCEALTSFLNTGSKSHLRELDLSNNDLQNSGIKLLSSTLEDPKWRLEILRLSGCMITEQGFSALASALESNPSYLKELDLSYNHPGESGEKLLSARLEDTHCNVLLRMEPKGEQFIKPGIKKYSCRLTLDRNTAYKHLFLSEDNRKVTRVNENQGYPDHPERFDVFAQVLCRESLSDRCYWEVEITDSEPEIGLTYAEILRKEDDLAVHEASAQLGMNVVSWSLGRSKTHYYARYDSEYTDIYGPPCTKSDRIGVFLDWPAGILSFYRVSPDCKTVSHVHTFKTVFKKPLFPGFCVDYGSLTLCELD
ncbi:NACHT, LRR and PYD domains-containing protein 3 [Hoplias malabaricus]|uniref:NACHT, LRR and PYD domains-containing protein 3 n=1 Tax=Hoplias malabaricus TaxID=27720 RepID=UPI003463572E